jgi:flagellar hook-associated protein 3 FlgL
MVPSINPSSDLFLANLQQIQDRASKAQQQITSGLRVSAASDDPDQVSSILLLRAQIAGLQQTQTNLANVGPRVDSAESAIQQAIQVLDSATTLAAQAVTGTADAGQRANLAPQAQAYLEQLVSLSQTAVNGHYVFSGDQDTQVAYTLDLTSGNGVQQMIVPGPPGQILDTNGVPFPVGLTAQQIFDDRNPDGSFAADNVFAAVSGLMTALQNNDVTGIQNALDNLKAASAHLNTESSFYGAVQNRIADANNTAGQTLIDLQKQLSDKQDADIVQASLDLNSALTNEQAALAAQAMLKPRSLFDYLG